MPPRPRPNCDVCNEQQSKYACASCRANYCSVSCYKQHKEVCPRARDEAGTSTTRPRSIGHELEAPPLPSAVQDSTSPESSPSNDSLQDLNPNPKSLRPLTSLKWPYVPEESAYPDPLKRDDPKALQLHQYEAIATSPQIRTLLNSNPQLLTLLTHLDTLRGTDREEALQRTLGVDSRQLANTSYKDGIGGRKELDDDTRALRSLAEAVEEAVRGGREDVLGLDWDT